MPPTPKNSPLPGIEIIHTTKDLIVTVLRMGRAVVTIDCRQDFSDSRPLADAIVSRYKSHAALVEAAELGLILSEGGLIDFKKYGFKSDDDISKFIAAALAQSKEQGEAK